MVWLAYWRSGTPHQRPAALTSQKCKVCGPHNEGTGVKVQCTHGKCVQAYHFTCAEADPKCKTNLWQVEQLVKEDETKEDSAMVLDISLKLELLCPAHNPVSVQLSVTAWNEADGHMYGRHDEQESKKRWPTETSTQAWSLTDEQEQKAIREQEKLEDMRRQLLAMIPGQSIKLKMGLAVPHRLVRVLEQEQTVEVDIDG